MDGAAGFAEGASLTQPAFSPQRHRVLPEDLEDYSSRGGVRTAQYHRPPQNIMGRRAPASAQGASEEKGPQAAPREESGFKTERWREKGAQRWPRQAGELVVTQPCQFHRSEEVVPLQRTVASPQGNIPSEMWCRSLRARHLKVQDLGQHNQNLTSVPISELFDRSGHGWSGKTNSKSSGRPAPSMKEWVERPVAVGKMSLDHMAGSRYAMSLTPRTCVPNSMAHVRSSSASTSRPAPPQTAR